MKSSLSSLILVSLSACTSETTDVDSADTVVEPSADEVPESFEVTGQIVDEEGQPIADAYVMVGGRSETMVLSGSDGQFSLWYTNIP